MCRGIISHLFDGDPQTRQISLSHLRRSSMEHNMVGAVREESKLMARELIEAFTLRGRTAVITGAASGIGRETARILAEAGARTVISDVKGLGVPATAELVAEVGHAAVTCPADVGVRADVEALAERAVEQTGRIDVWVNVAGILVSRPILSVEEDEVDRLLAVNLKG
jgi:3-oxoacyl-[acyl-carrier protein] reductase